MGEYLDEPDTVKYRVRAKILDDAGNPLWCVLFNKTAEILFGCAATTLFDQVKKLNLNEGNWHKQLIKELQKIRVNLTIQCRLSKWNDEANEKKTQNINWIVEELEAYDF